MPNLREIVSFPWSGILRRTGALGIAGLLMIGLLSSAVAQTADDALRFAHHQPATGVRMMGFAGAGIAGVANYGALFTNPAGLGYYETSEAAGTFSILRVQDDARYQVGGESPRFWDQTTSNYGLGNAALIYKFPTKRGSMVFGGSFNQTNTFERTLDYTGQNTLNSMTDTFLPFEGNFGVGSSGSPTFDFDLPRIAYNAGAIEFFQGDYEEGEYPFLQAVTPGTLIEQRDEVVEEGRITEASFGGAVEAAPGVMIGASLNIAFGTYRFDRVYRELDIGNENTPNLYSVLLSEGELLGFDELVVEEGIESDLTGVNLRGGLSAEVVSNLRAGFVIETPTWYSITETFGTRMTTFFDESDPPGLDNSLASGAPDANQFEYEVRTPWRIGGGLSYNSESLTVSGDVELVDWTQMELQADDASFGEVNDRIGDFKTVANLRVGAEYWFSNVALRGGFAYQPDPREVEIQLPDDETTDRSRTFYTAGLGYRFSEQLQFNVAWMQERFDDQYRPYATGLLPEGSGDAPYVDEEIIRNRVLIGLSYTF